MKVRDAKSSVYRANAPRRQDCQITLLPLTRLRLEEYRARCFISVDHRVLIRSRVFSMFIAQFARGQ